MADKLSERKEKIHHAISGHDTADMVSDEMMFEQLGQKIKRG
jgi:hypothetical protein